MRARPIAAFLLLIALAAAGALSVGAAEEDPGDAPAAPAEERQEKDYAPFPNPGAGYVTDLADVLSDEEEEQIERWLWQTESRTKVEIIVMTIHSIQDYPDTPNRTIEEFATGLFDAYGIGNLPANNGVLLLVATEDRKARVELGAGYGRGRDRDAQRIMQNVIVPQFRRDDYAAGITKGTQAIMQEFAEVRVGLNWPLIGTAAGILCVGLIVVSLFRSGKRGWGWVAVGFLFVLILGFFYFLRRAAEHMPNTPSGSWSSGGMGGFGGGSSGGGGATGSW